MKNEWLITLGSGWERSTTIKTLRNLAIRRRKLSSLLGDLTPKVGQVAYLLDTVGGGRTSLVASRPTGRRLVADLLFDLCKVNDYPALPVGY